MKALALAVVCSLLAAAAHGQSRSLVTDEVDQFVLAHFDKIQPRSIRENREYCGLVGFDANDRLAITPARPGTVDSCDPGDDPPGWEVIASYHTHGGFLEYADSEVPSVDDLLGDFEEGIDGYVATPGGRVWLNLLEERLTFQLCGRNCVVADPKARPWKAFAPMIEYTLPALREREKTDPGVC
ncbi:MAG: DUF4329 domain-containing protein [Pseudomonadota bacterium]